MADETIIEEVPQLGQQQPGAARKDPKEKQKLIAGIVFLVISVFLMVKRFPKSQYAEVVADKPLPAASTPAPYTPPPAPKPEPPKPIEPASAAKPGMPATAGGKPAAEAAVVRTGPPPLSEWEDPCAAEIGILCYKVPARELRKCLRRYDESLRRTCREAFHGKRR